MNRFLTVWRLGYAINFSKGRKPIRETALEVTFGRDGKWRRLFWRVYFKTSNKGYLNEQVG